MEKITIGINSISKEMKKKVIEKIGLSKLWVPDNTYFGTKVVKKYKFDIIDGKEEFEVPVDFEFLNFAAEVNVMNVARYVDLLEKDLKGMLKNTYANVYIGYSIFDTDYEIFLCDNTIVDIIPFVVMINDRPAIEMEGDKYTYLHKRYGDLKEADARKYKFLAEMDPDIFMKEQEKLEKIK